MCPQRLKARGLEWTGLLPSFTGADWWGEGAGGVICTVMEMALSPDLAKAKPNHSQLNLSPLSQLSSDSLNRWSMGFLKTLYCVQRTYT
jgi:hypothetical protein